ncbi:ADOP family duplicated permease [Gemmatimonadota bacterium]
MSRRNVWKRVFFLSESRRHMEAQVDEDLEFLIENLIERFTDQGMSEEEARAEIQQRFNNMEATRSALIDRSERSVRRLRWRFFLGGLRYDLKSGLRQVLRSPGFTFVTVMTLALGIGANTAVFSVINGVLLKPLPFDEPEELVGAWHRAPGAGFDQLTQSPATYFTYREENRVFEDIGLWNKTQVSITGLAEPEHVEALMVTEGTMPILRIQPVLGRRFSAAEDSPGSPDTVILSYAYWERRLGGDRGAIGRMLNVDGRPRQIIGVMPPDFRFLGSVPAVFIPLQLNRSEVYVGDFSYRAVARLTPGISIEQADADVSRMIPMVFEKFTGGLTADMAEEAGFDSFIRPLKQDVVGDTGRLLWLLAGTVGIVLLIACANVANLFLVRVDGRQQELAVRTAMGANRGRIARELLFDSTALGLLGGLVGLLLAYAGIQLLVALGPEGIPRLEEITIEPVVLLFTLGISVLAGLLFGLIPAIKYTRPRLASALKEGGRTSSTGHERHRARSILVVTQISLALVLLVSSGLMVRSFLALRQVEPGFVQPEAVLTFKIPVAEAEIPDPEQAARAHEQIQRRIQQIPGVESVGLSSSITMDGMNISDTVYIREFPLQGSQIAPVRRFKWVSEHYLETMGNPVKAGRAITWAEINNHAHVVMVTENFARAYWDDPSDAIGKHVRATLNTDWHEIIGVTGNVHDDGVGEEPTPVVFWPMLVDNLWNEGLFIQRTMGYAVRTNRLNDPVLMGEIRRVVRTVNSNLPIMNAQTLEEILEESMARTSIMLILLAIASSLALLLGSVGMYGVISYSVSQRTREIGIRMAIGARQEDINRLFIRHGLFLTGTGVAVGLIAATGLTQLMSSLLYGTDPVDPITYIIVSIVLSGVALLATLVPSRRAATMDPVDALNRE